MTQKPMIPNLIEDAPAPQRVLVEVTAWQAERLLRWNVPAELCGPSLAERIEFLIDDYALGLEGAETDRRHVAEYRAFNPSYKDTTDDEVPF